jgi:hypothetical protein
MRGPRGRHISSNPQGPEEGLFGLDLYAGLVLVRIRIGRDVALPGIGRSQLRRIDSLDLEGGRIGRRRKGIGVRS